MAENAIVYGNRYREDNKEINDCLEKAEVAFMKGNFKLSLETSINAINIVEPGIHKRLLSAYEKQFFVDKNVLYEYNLIHKAIDEDGL